MAKRPGRSFEKSVERMDFDRLNDVSDEVLNNEDYEELETKSQSVDKFGFSFGDLLGKFSQNLPEKEMSVEDIVETSLPEADDIDFYENFDIDKAVEEVKLDTFDIDEAIEDSKLEDFELNDAITEMDEYFLKLDKDLEEINQSPVVLSEVEKKQPKPRKDSRKDGIKISKGLEEKLGSYNTNGINILVNFDRMLKQQMELSSCSDEMRVAIAEKMVGLTDLLAKIYKITKSHKSNDIKKQKLEELLDGVSVIVLCGKLSEEIEATRKILINKAKEVAKNINESIVEEANQRRSEVELPVEENGIKNEKSPDLGDERKAFNPENDIPTFNRRGTSLTAEDEKMLDNILGNATDKEQFDAEEETIDVDKLFEVEEDKEEKALAKHEKVGFFGKIKRFFSELRGAYKSGKEAAETNNASRKNTKSSETGKSENKGEYTKAGFGVMGKVKDMLNAAIEDKSGREVTPNVIENIAGRIATFSRDKRIGEMCKGIVKDTWEFTNVLAYNIGDYVVEGTSRGINTIRNSKNEKGMSR